ncbi:MAG TPA: DHH family phosphoesterase [Candidatus Ornithomonoglobus intestinigallinarum]|uniref:Cyclic-di-AMP phosphodiesterase n=1 Tax=Candidatus Ornithomonoglobus intestinigallinarum TaxID=2840894 RepID=A0A9D1KQG0_9FIRM|nr:DHH family phosphoesterase [Candidatus Ornithomonoglobus intestinigallinarum]
MNKRYGQTMRFLTAASLVLAVITIAGGVLCMFSDFRYAGIVQTVIGAAAAVYFIVRMRRRRAVMSDYARILGSENNPVSSNIMASFPIPMVVAHIDGSVRWYNGRFSELMDNEDMFERMLEKLVPGIKWSNILKSASNIDMELTIRGRQYRIIGNMLKDRSQTAVADEDKSSIYLYFLDETTEKELQTLYENEKTDVAVVNIDNYEEVFRRVDDSDEDQITSQIRRCLNEWAKTGNAILKNTDRDRYFLFFEHKYLQTFTDEKFKILDSVRAIGEGMRIPVSISIGVGCGGSINENEAAARNALDMALGRGGDQVCIKDDTQYRFFGGKSREYEKSTRVKTRAVAVALKDFMRQSDMVIFVGHSAADYDCFGAAMGLQRAARALGKRAHVVHDNMSPAIKQLYDRLREDAEYKGIFVSPEDALEELTPNTLLVVLDTHRPSMLPDKRLVERAEKIVLIDHHRRSTEFINPCSLVYHEPYASSTCEMVTELLEYMDLGSALTEIEAECLYTGILMDTKNFLLKTGVRTFEAASYLRRLGLNTAAVKQLFNVDKQDYDHKVDIVKTASEVADGIAVAKTYEKYHNIKVIASQAADEMLNIGKIKASFVIYPFDDGAGVSARSLGDINVQLIVEKLGGGGHMTVAGAQLKNTDIDTAVRMTEQAVREYIKENA